MKTKTFPKLLSSLVLYTLSAYGDELPQQAPCHPSPEPYRLTASHIEGKGIGYNKGYTSLDLFLSHLYGNSLPFLDLRGHVFNDGLFAANAGVGYRYLKGHYVFGGNLFYDYRNTNRLHYNQMSAGFEVLGDQWDFRLNGYLPVGRTHSSWYQSKFGGFEGHSLLVRRKQQFAMKGLMAEAGIYTNPEKAFKLYGAAGPYYYEGQGRNTYGGKLRLNGSYKNFISLELSGSYDTIFRDIFQARLSFSLPLGPKNCSPKSPALQQRLVQPVGHEEIIVLDHKHKNFAAIDPITEAPYTFIFVNNTSHSQGTFESPYPTLDDAVNNSNPGDIIYIFPGDGTANGLTTTVGYQLQDNQQVLGSGFGYTLNTTAGIVSIPSLAPGLPQLLASDSTNGLILVGNNNTIAGLMLVANGTGDQCIGALDNVTNFTALNNLIEPIGSNEAGIDIDTALGTYILSNNTVIDQGDSRVGFEISSIADLNLSILNNTFQTDDDYCDIYSVTGTLNLTCQNNTGSEGSGYYFEQSDPSVFNLFPFTGNTPDTYNSSGTINPVP